MADNDIHETNRNTKTFPPIVSTIGRLVYSGSYGLELSKTRETCRRTRRTGHDRLAKAGPEAYKKKPVGPVEPSFWPMKQKKKEKPGQRPNPSFLEFTASARCPRNDRVEDFFNFFLVKVVVWEGAKIICRPS